MATAAPGTCQALSASWTMASPAVASTVWAGAAAGSAGARERTNRRRHASREQTFTFTSITGSPILATFRDRNPGAAENAVTTGLVSLSNTRVFGLESGTWFRPHITQEAFSMAGGGSLGPTNITRRKSVKSGKNQTTEAGSRKA